jgi:hypothetical protein
MGWNWGAFLLPWNWSLRHNVPVRHLFIPLFGDYYWPFYLGRNGSRLAWENGQWDSAEHFMRVQKRWAIYGFAYAGFLIAFILYLIIIGLMQ